MSDIDEIKSRLNIVDVIGARIPLKKAGRNFKALCPFHNEKTPSFIVSPDRQIFHCFGCGRGGSIFDFVMAFDRLDFPEALMDLAQQAGVKLERRVFDTPQDKLKQRLYEVNHLASEFYHYLLTDHSLGEKARLYLKNRGISDKSIKTFVLGYSPNSWDGLGKYLKKKGYDEELLEQAGLVIRTQNSERNDQTRARFYDRFRGRVMFTLKDHRGNVVGFSGRVLEAQAKEAKYINTSETPVYSKSNVLYGLDVTRTNIQDANEAVLMEGEFDVISSFQAGIGNVVAIKGSALTEGHARLLRRFAERLVFALDSDVAGDAAARRGIEIAEAAGFDMRVMTPAGGKDPDEVARTNAGLLKKALKEAIPVYDYFIASALARFDATSAFGKKKISEELLPIVAKIENPVVQGHYIKKLAGALAVTEATITEGLRKLKKLTSGKTSETLPAKIQSAANRWEKLEVYVLALILQGEAAARLEELRNQIQYQDLTQRVVAQILEKLEKFLQDHRVFLLKDFADSLPKELLSAFDEACLWDISDFIEDEERSAREWGKALWELRRGIFKRKIKELTNLSKAKDLAPAAASKSQNQLKELTDELKRVEKSSPV